MYLNSFAHREKLFDIAERWFCGRLYPSDALALTEIFIADGFILGETLRTLCKSLLETLQRGPFQEKRISIKGELRDALCRGERCATPRIEELVHLYQRNPDFFFRETPINGVMCLDEAGQLSGIYRIKRPRRIAEKANRKIGNWVFRLVQNTAKVMAEERAKRSGVLLENLLTPEEEMIREFMDAEEATARGFSEMRIQFDRNSITINDVGGLKLVVEDQELPAFLQQLENHEHFRVVEKETFWGSYRATNIILDVDWDAESICRRYRDTGGWEKYRHRGIPDDRLQRGLEEFLGDTRPNIYVELILSNYVDLVESELGSCIHERRIVNQREKRLYVGNIPRNIEFLLEYLFAVGFSPQTTLDRIPISLWGRYLPDTLVSLIRKLYNIPEFDLFY